MTQARQYLDRATSDRGVENRATDYTPYRQPNVRVPRDRFEIHPPRRWAWLADHDQFDRDVSRVEALAAELQSAPDTPETIRKQQQHDRLKVQLATARDEKRNLSSDELDEQLVGLPVALQNGKAETETAWRRVTDAYLGSAPGAGMGAGGGVIEGGGKTLKGRLPDFGSSGVGPGEILDGFGKAISVVATFLERMEKIEKQLQEQQISEIGQFLSSRLDVWTQAVEHNFQHYVGRGRQGIEEFRSGNQTCTAMVEFLQAQHDDCFRRHRELGDELLIKSLRTALAMLEERLLKPKAGRQTDKGTQKNQHLQTNQPSKPRSSAFSISPPSQWPGFHNCAAFDTNVASLRRLTDQLAADPANAALKEQRDTLDEQVVEAFYAIKENNVRQLLYQGQAFPSILADVDDLVTEFRNTMNEHFAHEEPGWAYAQLGTGLAESVGKGIGFKPLEGFSKIAGSITLYFDRAAQQDRALAKQQWKTIEQALVARTKAWLDGLKRAFDLYRENAERQLERFGAASQSCAVTRDNLQAGYDKWIERSEALTKRLGEELQLAMDNVRLSLLQKR